MPSTAAGLPAGLKFDAAGLSELNLAGNPGALFRLAVRLVRTDADPWVPGPARVEPACPKALPSPCPPRSGRRALNYLPRPSPSRLSRRRRPARERFCCPWRPTRPCRRMSAATCRTGGIPASAACPPGLPAAAAVQAGAGGDDPSTPAFSADGDWATIPLAELFAPSGGQPAVLRRRVRPPGSAQHVHRRRSLGAGRQRGWR